MVTPFSIDRHLPIVCLVQYHSMKARGSGSVAPRVPNFAIVCDDRSALHSGHFVSGNNWKAGCACCGCGL